MNQLPSVIRRAVVNHQQLEIYALLRRDGAVRFLKCLRRIEARDNHGNLHRGQWCLATQPERTAPSCIDGNALRLLVRNPSLRFAYSS